MYASYGGCGHGTSDKHRQTVVNRILGQTLSFRPLVRLITLVNYQFKSTQRTTLFFYITDILPVAVKALKRAYYYHFISLSCGQFSRPLGIFVSYYAKYFWY